MVERDDCIHYRTHERVRREGNRKDTPWEVIKKFYCINGKAMVGGCQDNCPFFEQKK